MADALLNLEGNEAATVLIVDWRGGSQPPYGQAVANIRLVGAMTAHLVHNIYVSSCITLTRDTVLFTGLDLSRFVCLGYTYVAEL